MDRAVGAQGAGILRDSLLDVHFINETLAVLQHNGSVDGVRWIWGLGWETMAVRKTTKRLYLIPVLSKALDILELMQAENQPMTLEAIHRQTRISKTTVYRVLKTFVHRGYLSQSPDGLYRQVTRPKKLW